MPEEPKKPKTFEAAQPKIPGVPPPKPKDAMQESQTEWRAWIRQPLMLGGAGAVLLLVLIAVVWWTHGTTGAAQPGQVPISDAAGEKQTPATATEVIPTGPGKIATTDQLTEIWAAKKFYFRDAGMKSSPAMVVHLPGNAYWAFSLREPYGSCELEFVTDMSKLHNDYNFDATHPMVGDPCTHTVYDLMTYGPGPNGLVRGAAVAGPSVRPPFAIELEIQGKEILATRSE